MGDNVIETMNDWLSKRLGGFFQGNQHAYASSCAHMLTEYLRDQGVSADELAHRNIDVNQFVTNYFSTASGRA